MKKADKKEASAMSTPEDSPTAAAGSPRRSLSPIQEEREEEDMAVDKASAEDKGEKEKEEEDIDVDVEASEEGEICSGSEKESETTMPEPETKADLPAEFDEKEEGEIKDEEEEVEEKRKVEEEKSQETPSPVPEAPSKTKGKGRRPHKKSVQSPVSSADQSAAADLTTNTEQSLTSKDVNEGETSEMEVDVKEEVAASSAEEETRPYVNPAIAEHDYSAAPVKRKTVSLDDRDSEVTDSADESAVDLYQEVWIEHNYCLPIPRDDVTGVTLVTGKKQAPVSEPAPAKAPKLKKSKKEEAAAAALEPTPEVPAKKAKGKKEPKAVGRPKKEKLKDITNKASRELAQLLPDDHVPKSPISFEPRSIQEERQVGMSTGCLCVFVIVCVFVCMCVCGGGVSVYAGCMLHIAWVGLHRLQPDFRNQIFFFLKAIKNGFEMRFESDFSPFRIYTFT